MDKIAGKITSLLGSAPVIGLFGLWTFAHAVITHSYVATISDLAILIGLLILRAEDAQSKLTHDAVLKDVRQGKKILKKLK